MSIKPITTAWMWQDEFSSSTMGATINTKELTIDWFDKIGCACDPASGQSFSDYLKRGAPAKIGSVPSDVAEQLQTAIVHLGG